MIYQDEQADGLSSPGLSSAGICGVGAGSWETPPAYVARRAGCKTAIRGRDQANVDAIRTILHQGVDVHQTFADFRSPPIEGELGGLSISIGYPIAMAAEAAQ